MQIRRDTHDPAEACSAKHRRWPIRSLLSWLRADTRGATLTQQVMVIGLAVAGMAGFSKFGSALHDQLDGEAARIQGRGKPGLALSLESLAPSFQPLPLACPGGSCRCFAAGTPVATEAGDRPIESLNVGDLVWATNPDTGELALRPVLHRFVTHGQPVIQVELYSDAVGEERLYVTPGHPFWVDGDGWVRAFELSADQLRSPHGALWGMATADHVEPISVYNLEVAEFHNYFVGQAHALVHNADGEGGGLTCDGRALAAVPPGDGAEPPAEDAATERAREREETRLAAEQRRREREQKRCETSVAADLNRYRRDTGNDYTPASGRGLPKTREELIAALCKEMANDCRPAASVAQCLAQSRCLARRAAEHDNFSYFRGNEATRNNLRAICADEPDLIRSCYKGDPVELPPAFGGSNPKNAEGSRDPQVSQQAGEAAARAYQQQAHSEQDGWTCFEDVEGVANVFDLACYHEDGRVAIIEAKGGEAGKGTRKNSNKTLKVEQGTLEYVKTLAKAIRASGKGGGEELARRIDALADDEDAISSGQLSYVLVRQRFRDGNAADGSAFDGDPRNVQIRHFDLNADNCN